MPLRRSITISPMRLVLTSRSIAFCSSCSMPSAAPSSSERGTFRFSQARIMPPRTFWRSKLSRLPSFFTTMMGRLSTVS